MKLAEGSNSQALSTAPACVRALDSYISISQSADRLDHALDSETFPGYFHALDDDDSLVVAIRTMVEGDSGKKPQIGG